MPRDLRAGEAFASFDCGKSKRLTKRREWLVHVVVGGPGQFGRALRDRWVDNPGKTSSGAFRGTF